MKPDLERKVHQIYEVVGFRSVGPYTLEIEFDDGISRKIDFEGVLEGELYGPLKDLTVFQRVKLDREGGNLVWPSGADFDPEILHDWPERKAAMLAAAVRWRKGEYAVRKGNSGRATAVEPTQAEAIKKARELNPKMPPKVERVRNTKTGGRDKWRKP